MNQTVIVLDFGGQYSQLIARRIREAKVYCEVLPWKTPLDTIREKQPKNLYICGAAPELYLYAELPYATYSPITLQHALDLVDRHVQYWKLHPERLPACIYVPFDDAYNDGGSNEDETAAILARIDEVFGPLCTYTSEMGQSGCILYVTQWTLDT